MKMKKLALCAMVWCLGLASSFAVSDGEIHARAAVLMDAKTGEVLKRVEQRGYKIERLEVRTNVSNELIDQHYEALLTKDFYPSIRDYMTSGPVIIGVLSGSQVISGPLVL